MTTNKEFPKFYQMDDNLFVKIFVNPQTNLVTTITNKGKKYPSIGIAMSEGKEVTREDFMKSTHQQ